MRMSNKIRSATAFLLIFLVRSGSAQMPSAIDTRIDEFDDLMGFEVAAGDALPDEWAVRTGESGGTVRLDRDVFRSGQSSARLTLDPTIGSGLSLFIPIDFAGSNVELRAFVRTENVSRLSQALGADGPDTPPLGPIEDISNWTEYQVSAPLDPNADILNVGAGVGTGMQGTVWIDDLELLVDGVPLRELRRIDTLTDERRAALIARAESAATAAVASDATIKTFYAGEIKTLREGSNDYTCWAVTVSGIGPMCNDPGWEDWLAAFTNGDESYEVEQFSVSYMLAGEGDRPHVMVLHPDHDRLDINPFAYTTIAVADEPLRERSSPGFQLLTIAPFR